jgi:hypothetical protein
MFVSGRHLLYPPSPSHVNRAIHTYRNRGVSKPGLLKWQHAIIYSTDEPPQPRQDELPDLTRGELGMLGEPIRVNVLSKVNHLLPMSRINFAKVYTVEHNAKVFDVGQVAKEHLRLLRKYWEFVIKTPPNRSDGANWGLSTIEDEGNAEGT